MTESSGTEGRRKLACPPAPTRTSGVRRPRPTRGAGGSQIGRVQAHASSWLAVGSVRHWQDLLPSTGRGGQ
jgi:hypothetical protein